jgi:hypothetical protein
LLHVKPIYVEDLVIVDNTIEETRKDTSFIQIYIVVMNLILSILFAVFSEYVIIQGITDKPVIEVFAIIGGNLSLYIKTQNTVGNVLLKFCYNIKEKETIKRNISQTNSPNPNTNPNHISMVTQIQPPCLELNTL